ncbi:MAG: bifunctional 3-hydroxydecanoyl-ACP dehydratase/trans-2-decenoyl-ACP isomerase [alpha proteobacterium HIMB59]|nr:MAG: bifunctional 3-hydroxydecanoyl-ACP dehydratase/trans-2-decenoyl-ACP isomerase [alpha proteobacterium HIMB59]
MNNFTPQSSFSYEEIIECGKGNLFGPGNAQLPAPPMLMFDRITQVNKDGGMHGKGEIIAALDIKPDLWFFECHFIGDPVMPGCLGLDALWQMLGFYLGWLGYPGKGRALGVGEIKFVEEIKPDKQLIQYKVNIKKSMSKKGFSIGYGDGQIIHQDKIIYHANDLKVGLFNE